ncbi:MAG TPA: IspD/TarI family cytidylyltransferase [Pseudonocardia sp.]|nr:IspD/TarI family cytidylyltransferase [Pseudonocardia sp.]
MRASTTAAAVVLAGGSGSRVGAAENKVYLPLAGRPMIVWSLSAFVGAPGIDTVVLVVRAGDRARAADVLAAEPALAGVRTVVGGATRQASELAALEHLAGRIESGRLDVVLLHDGARPLVSPALVAAVLRTAGKCGGAVPGLPRTDLGVAAPESVAAESVVAGAGTPGCGALAGPATAGLVAVQTPQGFRAAPLLAAYREAHRCGFAGTDTASCVQRFAPQLPIRAIPGEQRNIKVTYPHDVVLADRVLAG